jgi:hypothetical protein
MTDDRSVTGRYNASMSRVLARATKYFALLEVGYALSLG